MHRPEPPVISGPIGQKIRRGRSCEIIGVLMKQDIECGRQTVVTDEWLETINREFRHLDISPKRRPWLAIQKYSEQFRCSISLTSPIAEKIFKWFENNTQPGVHNIGSLFTGVYYFDSCFWPVSIPMGYGTYALNALDSLVSMPEQLKNDIMSVSPQVWDYVLFWADCVDYGYGFDDLSKRGGIDPFGIKLLKSGHAELNAAISQLCEFRPNSKSSMSSRMAVEMFLKALIAIKEGLSESGAKKLGHNLDAAMDKCISLTNDKTLIAAKKEISIFPAIDERYSGTESAHSELWKTYAIAQCVATAVIRTFTDRDIRPQIISRISPV